jgi:hypothetical protein
LRNLFSALSLACLLVLAAFVPAVSASTPTLSTAKVVIIVGPVEGTTPSYIADANSTATVARQYSSNVVTIYSPYATWANVEPALQGASIVIYFGHGNGWPSKWTPFQENTKDGLGLNAASHAGDSNVKYYGANDLKTYVKLAPNAVVILGHLCYSAGNSEQGDPAPTLDVAEQRVDNMGAGWLHTGARAVISEPYSNMEGWYLQNLFSTFQSIGDMWLAAPNHNNNVTTLSSVRTSWSTVQLDPNPGSTTQSQHFSRAISGDMTLFSGSVVGSSVPSPYGKVSLGQPGSSGRATGSIIQVQVVRLHLR